jgi:phosphoribosyl-ATP pyrophosphohydrolase
LPAASRLGRQTYVPTASRFKKSDRPLDKLERTIADRAANPREKSYTTQLLAGGVGKISGKVIEEVAEVIAAASETGEAGREHFIREVGDLMYHLLVLMRQQNCGLADVESELARRFGVSGLEEKASRKKKPPAKKAAAKTTPRRKSKKSSGSRL